MSRVVYYYTPSGSSDMSQRCMTRDTTDDHTYTAHAQVNWVTPLLLSGCIIFIINTEASRHATGWLISLPSLSVPSWCTESVASRMKGHRYIAQVSCGHIDHNTSVYTYTMQDCSHAWLACQTVLLVIFFLQFFWTSPSHHWACSLSPIPILISVSHVYMYMYILL